MILTDSEIRNACTEVTEFNQALRKLIKSMFKKMHQWEGVGLAANQVGIPLQIFVMKVGKTKYTCINPKVVRFSAEVEFGEEGCLSVPNTKLMVSRRKDIGIEYYDEYGNKHYQGFTGLEARCVQHEIDHLDGILIMDYKHE